MSGSKNLGLRPTLLCKSEEDFMAFKKVVVPSSMRSQLWKHFGFPANENHEILTKSKIVCCICYQMIAYNKNTTNLSTHLNNKHPEMLTKIKKHSRTGENSMDAPISPKRRATEQMTVNWYANNDIEHSIEPNKIQQQQHPTGITSKAYSRDKKSIYKPKFQITENMDDLTDVPDITEHEHESQFIETIDYADIDIHEEDNEIIAEVLDDDDSATHSNRSKDDFLSAQYMTIDGNNEVMYENARKKTIIATKSPLKTNSNDNNPTESFDYADIMEQMKKFLIKDLVASNIVDGSGFKEMITFFSHNTDIPDSIQIENSIEKDFKQQQTRALSNVKSAMDSRCYSLLFHRLGNSSMVEISINYWLDGGDRISPLENQIWCISKNCSNILLDFGESLSNCSTFVADFDLESELNGNVAQELISNIPIIPTFSYVTKIAFDACLQLQAIQTAIESADALMGGKVKAAHTWLQKFELLSQFLNEPNHNETSQIIQVLIECIQPLKNCLDILAFETSAYASIMKPVVKHKLIDQHYGDTVVTQLNESDIVAVLEKELKQTILKVFQQHIIDNPFLAMATFLDPRFLSLTEPDDLKSIRNELEKYIENDEPKMVPRKLDGKPVRLTNDKHFGLSSLFSNLTPTVKSESPKSRFDMEFQSYTEHANLDMDFCPLVWWDRNDISQVYPSIKKHVKKYFCVPSFINNVHRMSLADQEEIEQKYERLDSNEPNVELLWLHLNELRQRLLEA